MLSNFADLVVKYLKADFEEIHLSRNLADTIEVVSISNDELQIRIPAQMYDVAFFRKEKVIKYNGKGSYAIDVNDVSGGFSGKHIGFVEHAIIEASKEIGGTIEEWNLQ